MHQRKKPEIVVEYHSPKILLTVDFEVLMCRLFETFGPDLDILFRPMSPLERNSSAERIGEVEWVSERIHILYDVDGKPVRAREIESEIHSLP